MSKQVAKKWKSAAARRVIKLAGNVQSVEEALRVLAGRLLDSPADVPVDLEKVAQRLNVEKIEASDVPFSGELQRHGGRYRIVYSSYLSPDRKRFTIAHELGHALLESSGARTPKYGAELERICDRFAAELLMPAERFQADSGRTASLNKVISLSKTYQTSLSSTAIRFAELFSATVFEVNDQVITWSFGVVKKGPLVEKDPTLRASIEKLIHTKSPSDVMPYTTRTRSGQWLLEGQTLGTKRALFLFRPYDPAVQLSRAA